MQSSDLSPNEPSKKVANIYNPDDWCTHIINNFHTAQSTLFSAGV